MASQKSLDLTELFYKKSETRTRQEITSEIQNSIDDSEIIKGKINKSDIVDNLNSTASDKPLSANQGKVLKGNVDSKADSTTLNTEVNRLDGLIDNVEDDIVNINTNLNTKVDKVTGKGLSTNDYTTAEKNKLTNIESGANKTIVDSILNPLSTNPVQNKVICEEFYDKEDIVELLNNIQTGAGKLLTIYIDENTGDLVVDDDGFEYYTKTETDAKYPITIETQAPADPGFFATYVIKQGGVALSPKINIPKDFLLKSATIRTCTAANTPVQGFVVGDKYFDFVINSQDNSASDTHLYLNAKDLINDYSADEITLTMDANNVLSIKEVPVNLITGVLPANQVTHQDISMKVDKITGKGLSTNDYTDNEKTKLSNIESNANLYTHPTYNVAKSTSGLYKIKTNNLGHIIEITEVSKSDITALGIPGSDTNTTYSAGSGLNLDGTTFKHNNSVNAQSSSVLKKIKFDSEGHITGTDNVLSSDLPSHNHSISDVTNLQSSLNAKMNSAEYDTINLSVVFADSSTGSYDLVFRRSS